MVAFGKGRVPGRPTEPAAGEGNVPGAGWHRPEGLLDQQDGIRKAPGLCRAEGRVDYLPPPGGDGRGALGLPGVPAGRAVAMGIWTLEKPHAALFRPNAAPSSLPSVHASVVYRAREPI